MEHVWANAPLEGILHLHWSQQPISTDDKYPCFLQIWFLLYTHIMLSFKWPNPPNSQSVKVVIYNPFPIYIIYIYIYILIYTPRSGWYILFTSPNLRWFFMELHLSWKTLWISRHAGSGGDCMGAVVLPHFCTKMIWFCSKLKFHVKHFQETGKTFTSAHLFFLRPWGLHPAYRQQLRRIRSFLKLDIARTYLDRAGRKRVVRYSDMGDHPVK